jgi:hypothetical protein
MPYRRASLVAGCWLLAAGLTGCESLQRKLIRKPKHPPAPPSPIINFQDYTKTTTPLERYRKHYLMFEYWNDELMRALRSSPPNPKRLKRASTEALAELETLKGLVTDDLAVRMAPLVEERSALNRQLHSGSLGAFQANSIWRVLESQTRQVHRELFWRDVTDQLRP